MACCGIIPACAGNTPSAGSVPRSCRDHPRVCGEHFFLFFGRVVLWGSSPRVRGTPLLSWRGSRLRGIIPACAGNTFPRRARSMPYRDHPRVCGEHNGILVEDSPHKGSSPRVRGTRSSCCRAACGSGIIPACAGNTGREILGRADGRDHPRVCGEHLCCSVLTV